MHELHNSLHYLGISKRVVESPGGGRISGANRAEGGFGMEIQLSARLPVLQNAFRPESAL